jgi:hypothetical protein
MEAPQADIVDMQVNRGRTAFGPDCDFDLYAKNARELGITQAVVFPTPTHIVETPDGTETNCLWRPGTNAQHRYYIEHTKHDGSRTTVEQPPMPYDAYNRSTLQFVKEWNRRGDSPHLTMAAKIHPHLDDPKSLDRLSEEDIVAWKIHGIATHSNPEEFPRWMGEFLRSDGRPLVVHTDWYRGKKDAETPMATALRELCEANTPPAYIRWALRERVKLCINHGARLHIPSIHIINNEPDLMMAYGPDSHLEARQDHLARDTTDYPDALFAHARTDKVMFSTDYRWNVDGDAAWDALRWDSIERIRRLLSTEDQHKVLAENAISFYGLRGIKR